MPIEQSAIAGVIDSLTKELQTLHQRLAQVEAYVAPGPAEVAAPPARDLTAVEAELNPVAWWPPEAPISRVTRLANGQ